MSVQHFLSIFPTPRGWILKDLIRPEIVGLPRKISIDIEYGDEKRRFHLRKGRDETYLHIVIKLLAHIYFWKQDLPIEPSFRYRGYRPDLIRLDEPLNPKQVDKDIGLWIECKQVKLQKLDDLVRYTQAEIYWFHTKEYFEKVLIERNMRKYKRLEEVNFIAISCSSFRDLRKALQEGGKWDIREVSKIEKGKNEETTKQELQIGVPHLYDTIRVVFERLWVKES